MVTATRLAFVLTCLLLAACEPQDRRPGSWLSGEVVASKIDDWDFTNKFQEVQLQTHPWYRVPHSVTVVLATRDNKLYIPSVYVKEPKSFPDGKYWNRIVSKNPNVEVRIGNQLFPRKMYLVTDKEDFASGLSALADKYPFWRKVKDNPDEAPAFVILRLDDRDE